MWHENKYYKIIFISTIVILFSLPIATTNSTISYSLTNQNFTSKVVKMLPGQVVGYVDANFNYSFINVSIPGGNIVYFAQYYSPFNDFNRTVNLSHFNNIGVPSISNESTKEFVVSQVSIAGEYLHSLHGTISTGISNIQLKALTNASKNLPISGPVLNTSLSYNGNVQTGITAITVNFYDPVVSLSNGSLAYTPLVGYYSYTYSFNIVTYEEYGVYKIQESITPIDFSFSFNVVN